MSTALKAIVYLYLRSKNIYLRSKFLSIRVVHFVKIRTYKVKFFIQKSILLRQIRIAEAANAARLARAPIAERWEAAISAVKRGEQP